MKISAVILSKNEEKNIKRVIKSVEFCDEIIVIDDNSKDSTEKIAKKLGVKVLHRQLNGDFAAQRNYGIEESRGEWILFVDADEVVTEELKKELLEIIQENRKEIAYYIKRRDFWWGRELKYGEVLTARKKGFIRFIKRNSGKFVSPVHETFKTSDSISKLNGFLNHYPHPTLKEFLRDINFYSTLRAKELLKQNKKSSLFEIITYPTAKFLLNYFFKLGFLDGPAGFAYSFLMSFHSFLVRSKLYQYTRVRQLNEK